MNPERTEKSAKAHGLHLSVNSYDIQNPQGLDDLVWNDLEGFKRRENRILLRYCNDNAQSLDRDKLRRLFNACLNHSKNLEHLTDRIEDGYEALVSIAKDSQKHLAIGYSFAIVDINAPRPRIAESYIGVSQERHYAGRVGRILLAVGHRALAEKGFRRYIGSVNRFSFNLLQRLSDQGFVTFQRLDPPERIYSMYARVDVSIKQKDLTKLFDKLGLDYQQDPFTPYKVTF